MTGFEIIADIWPILLFSLFATGVIAGVMAGLLGVGGGIVIVPVLFWILGLLNFPSDVSMHIAVGTSLAIIIPTSLSSMRAHHKRQNVDWTLVKSWGPAIAMGALTGGIASKYVDGDVLRLVFGVVALLVSINMFRPHTINIAPKLPDSLSVQRAIGAMIGTLSALMGIGGGTLTVPTMALFNYDMRKAVGTASSFGLVIALPATIGFIWAGLGVENRPPFSLGYVSIIAACLIFPITVLTAPYGAKLAHHMNPVRLKKVFALFLGLTSIRMLWSIWG